MLDRIIVWLESKLAWKFAMDLMDETISRCWKLYLNGIEVWEYFSEGFFQRLGHYIGHGLCYEATALLMMVWKGNPDTRFVIGKCYSDKCGKLVDHAWMEIKHKGVWWALDPGWCSEALPEFRMLRNLNYKTKYERIISYEEFWNLPVTQEFYAKMQNPEESYLFYELAYFRQVDKKDARMFIEEIPELPNLKKLGRIPSVTSINQYGEDCPLTLRIIREYITNERRMTPKARTYRRARRLAKTVNAAVKEVQERWENGEKNFELRFKSLSEYEIVERNNVSSEIASA